MKTFKLVAAQGEITIRRIGDVPKKAQKIAGKPLALESGKFIIGHSETGHHHVLERNAGATVTVLDRAPEGMRILHAILTEANTLGHQRGHDTHETIELPPGEYEFRIAREYDHYAELARQSAD
jgi:hypothetical protein